MICVSVSHRDQLEKAVHSGADLLELRLDLIGESPVSLFPLIPTSMPVVVTCRPGTHDEQQRSVLLKQGLELGAAYADVETESSDAFLNSMKQSTEIHRAKLIVSYHNFERTPGIEDLESVMIACFEKGGDVAKIATRVHGSDDLLNLISLFSLPGQKVILGMGPLGRILRIMGPYLGGAFTFASVEAGKETAPGQLSIQEMKKLYSQIDRS